jgi:hypothetical protein
MRALALLLGGAVVAVLGLALSVAGLIAVFNSYAFGHAGGLSLLAWGVPLILLGFWAASRGRARYQSLAAKSTK